MADFDASLSAGLVVSIFYVLQRLWPFDIFFYQGCHTDVSGLSSYHLFF
jgi:hypothetical protein